MLKFLIKNNANILDEDSKGNNSINYALKRGSKISREIIDILHQSENEEKKELTEFLTET